MSESTWDELVLFVRKEADLDSRRMLTRQMSLERGLGITGDDVDDFIRKYFGKIVVDHGDFDIDSYFSGEGFNLS